VNEGAPTVRVNVVVCVSEPEDPVMISGYCPVGTVAPTLNVRLEYEVVGFVLNDAVTPVGSPEIERLTALLKPFTVFTLTEVDELCPCPTVIP
jgi:hypothetical protein